MKRFKKILIVFNGNVDNQSLFEHTVDLATKNKATITVMEVIEEAVQNISKPKSRETEKDIPEPKIQIIEEFHTKQSTPSTSEWKRKENMSEDSFSDRPIFNIREQIKQEEQRQLNLFAAKFQKEGIQTTTKIIIGIPFIEIIREVLQNNHDLVMVTAEGKGNIKETLFGSTTMHLMRKCPCPVWVIKAGQTRQFRRILAAVDLVQDDLERGKLAQKIMEIATSLAQMDKSELLILHAWRMYGESMLRGQGRLSDEVMESLLRETKEVQRQKLIELLQRSHLDGLSYEVYLLKGDAGNLISELVPAKEVDLIVMGTVSRAGLSGLLIGNTAEKVLHQVNCSVLTIKPEGFISPVKLE